MNARQARITLYSIVVVALAWVIAAMSGIRPDTPEAPASIQPAFQAPLALEQTREFVTRYPRRVIGSIEARQSTGFLQERFRALGYSVTYSHFTAMIAGRRQVGRNVYAFRPGASPEVVALVAHYDTSATTVQGAMDDGSGVGVLLELARLSSLTSSRRGLLFVASDGEEWGMLGAADLAKNHPDRERIVAAVSLDYVAAGDLAAITLDTMGQGKGYSPPWIRLLARGAVSAEGAPIAESTGVAEYLERALPYSWTDQGPFLSAGIAAVNLGSRSTDSSAEVAAYHGFDSIEGLRVASIATYGRTAERLLRALDTMGSVPRQSMGLFCPVDGSFIRPLVMTILQGLAFAPLLLVACFHFHNYGLAINIGRIRREFGSFLGTIFPLLIGYSWIILLARLRRLPLYSAYPATPRDPVLSHPQWGVLSSILLVVLVTAVGSFYLVRFINRRLPRPDFFASKSILLAIFCLVITGALAYNAYWAVCFLLLPAWVWGIVGIGNGVGGRSANRILILAAGVVYYMTLSSFASRLFVGWNLFWYQVLALGAGLFSWQAVLLSASVFALGLRFLTIQKLGAPS